MPPVATYVDDTPLFVNLRLQDLDRVEILRGPQGTLYGSGSLGGTIRYVQNAPDPSGFDAKDEVGVSDTAHTGQPNEDVNGMLNLPFADTFAVRLNAAWTYDAGLHQPTESVSAGLLGRADRRAAGQPVQCARDLCQGPRQRLSVQTARVAALWKPSDLLHAQLSYYYQLGTAGGFPYVATSAAAYTSADQLPAICRPGSQLQLYPATVPPGVDRLSNADNGPDTTRDEVNLAALTLEYDLGFATLTSATSWSHHVNDSTRR